MWWYVGLALVLFLATAEPTMAQRRGGPRCDDFSSQAAAQAAYDANPYTYHVLDRDHDGIACEWNPCPCTFRTPWPARPPEVALTAEVSGLSPVAPPADTPNLWVASVPWLPLVDRLSAVSPSEIARVDALPSGLPLMERLPIPWVGPPVDFQDRYAYALQLAGCSAAAEHVAVEVERRLALGYSPRVSVEFGVLEAARARALCPEVVESAD
jgi:hypothetical protein